MKYVFGFLAAILLPVVVHAGFEEGVAAYIRDDYDTAYRELLPLAQQGNAVAQLALGWMYREGHGAPQDYKEAMKWYRLVAEQGEADAQFNLGVMYVKGRGVPQDYVQAHLWYTLAAAQGHENAIKNRDIIANKMSPAQLAQAQQLAREWTAKKAAVPQP